MSVSVGGWLELDLLRQRRKDFDQIRHVVEPTGSLLRRGALVGAVVPALLLLVCGWLLLRDHVLTRESQRLGPIAQKHAEVDNAIKTVQAEVNQLTTENLAVARAMADVRSSSAFLTEIQRLIPINLELKSILISEENLTLIGAGIADSGFKTLNAFILNLQSSSFLEANSVRLEEAALKGLRQDQRLMYKLTSRFASNAAEETAARLPSLEADGMALRLAVIRELGLLP